MLPDAVRWVPRVLVLLLTSATMAGSVAPQTLSFQTTDLLIPEAPYAVAAGDFTGDGFADLAVAHGNTLRLYAGPAPGPTWTSIVIPSLLVGYWQSTGNEAVGDFNADGIDDLAIGYPYSPLVPNGAVQIFPGPNLAPGSMLLPPLAGTLQGFGERVAVGDLDADGTTDLFCLAPGAPAGPSTTGVVFTHLGPNLFPGPVFVNPTIGTVPFFFEIAVGDVNGDSAADLVGLTANGLVAVPGPSLLPSDAVFFDPNPLGGALVIGDFLQNGYEDVVMGGGSNVFEIYPSPALTPIQIFLGAGAVGTSLGPTASKGDLNGDGGDDLFVTRIGGTTLPGVGVIFPVYPPFMALATPAEYFNGLGTPFFGAQLGVADFDADGFDDFATAALPTFSWPPTAGIARVFKARSLEASAPSVSLGSGGTVALTIRASVTHAGRGYLILGSASGTYPGIPVGSLRIPIQPDPFTLSVLEQTNGPMFQGFFGALDADGEAVATIVVQAGQFTDPALFGVQLRFANVVFDATGMGIKVTSNPVTIELAP